MKNQTTLDLLIKLVNKKGALHVASILGQNTTRNIESWMLEKQIPRTKDILIRSVLTNDLKDKTQ